MWKSVGRYEISITLPVVYWHKRLLIVYHEDDVRGNTEGSLWKQSRDYETQNELEILKREELEIGEFRNPRSWISESCEIQGVGFRRVPKDMWDSQSRMVDLD